MRESLFRRSRTRQHWGVSVSSPEQPAHAAIVAAWVFAAGRLPPDGLLRAFDRAFGALWLRALRTLGDVTLTAIVARVVVHSVEKFPELAPLAVDAAGLRADGLRKRVESSSPGVRAEALGFVLVEFLTVLGYLTAEILTSPLHAELTRVLQSDPDLALDDERGRGR